jgi:LPXTG-motif cell wall-anchored protein
MRERNGEVRRTAAGLVAMVAGAVLLVGALAGGAGAAVERGSTHVTPTEVSGNAPCPEGLNELKVEPVEDGTFADEDGPLTVTLEITAFTDDDPQVFNWTSNIGVDVVIVKGGNKSNVYTYSPESTGDTGLHAPANPSGMFAGLSHISFCYDVEQETTTTTEATTTTTEEETTTTAEETTTTAAGETTTTVTVSGELPRTGSSSGPMVAIGAALLAGGAALVGFARRFRTS